MVFNATFKNISVIGGGNRSTRRKPLNIEFTIHYGGLNLERCQCRISNTVSQFIVLKSKGPITIFKILESSKICTFLYTFLYTDKYCKAAKPILVGAQVAQ